MELCSISVIYILMMLSFQVEAANGSLEVDISVLTDPGGRPSTNYRLGSTATLICHVENVTGPVTYHWSSTSTAFFAYNSSAMFNRKRLLSAADAGVHTCTVTDAYGNSGRESLTMMFKEIMVYVAESYDHEDVIVANNSAVLYHPGSCLNCPVVFYCFSNSTSSGVGELILPDGTTHHHNTDSSQLLVERLPFATLRVQVSNSQPITGLFTCRLPDSNGNTMETTIGLYSGTVGPPSINVLESGYTDLTMDPDDSSVFATVECYTMSSPPTIVTWKRDRVEVDVRRGDYSTLQVTVDRINSHYRNILLVRSILEIMRNHTFTCEIENIGGSTFYSVAIDIPVMVKASMEVTPHSGHEGETITLSCRGYTDPPKATAQLMRNITTEWVGPMGLGLTEENGITISTRRHNTHGVVSTLTVNGTKYSQAGVYSCVVTLNATDSPSVNSAEFHLTLKQNITIYETEQELTEAHRAVDGLACVWSGAPLSQMEWLFIGNYRIAPLTLTNKTWDMETLACWIQSSSGLQQVPEPLIIHGLIIKNVSIELSSSSPTAGEELRMTCSAVSDGLATLTWTDPRGERVTTNNPHVSLELVDGELSCLFQSLHTSHGGVYTCVASVGGTSSAQNMAAEHLLAIQIPQPVMSITFNPTDVYPSSQLSITCEVSLAQEVDTPVRVGMRWNAPTPIYGNNRMTMREDRSTSFVYKSILLINSVSFSDAGFYTCIAEIEPRDTDDSAVIGVPWTTEGMNLEIFLNVSIQVDYTPPDDFHLLSPPYYRPASSVSLACVAPPDAVPPLTYRWSSTCSSCFTSNNSSREISIDILRSSDGGVHTCTVTDAEGHTGSAQTEMSLYGAGVHITDNTGSRAVPNNTAIYHTCRSCPLTLHCYSNSTASVASTYITTPDNRDRASYSSYYYGINIQRVSPAGIRLRHLTNYRSATSGIYICKVPDSHGNQIQYSFGLYFSNPGRPVVYSSRHEYSSGSANSILSLECPSRNSIPSNVTWLRNNVTVDTLNGLYESVEIANRQYLTSSYFWNILIVRSVAGALGNQRYTCHIQNTFGNDSANFILQQEVITITTPSETLYGDALLLVCSSVALPTEYASRAHIQWRGLNDTSLDGMNGIAVGEQTSDGETSSRNLAFDFLRSFMDGVYTCQFSIGYMNETYTETKNYSLMVSGRISITGNDIPLVSGKARSIRCSWGSSGLARLAWYLEGLYTIPLASADSSSSVTLYLDPSITGLNDTTFVCRATDLLGYTYQNKTVVYVKDMSVDIQVRYVAPPDFGLSPPYYRPGSSLTLSCIATGASDSVAFQWRSTYPQSFTYGATNAVRSKSLLTAYDSWTHTCTITDTDRTTASARVKVFLYGVGLYVSESYGINQQSIANNTALSWRRHYRVRVRCYSNSTTDTGTLLLPNGLEYSSYSSGTYAIDRQSPSGIDFYTSTYNTPAVGIYTCRMTSRNGQVRDMSFGVYTTTISIPTLSPPEHRDLIEVAHEPALGMVVCNSSGFPPTHVSWKKGNTLLSTDDTSYQQIQRVVSRGSSLYSNILRLKDIHGVIGNHRYVCLIRNQAGAVSRAIEVSNTVEPVLSIQAPADPEYLSDLSLSCRVRVPQKLHRHLVPYMTLTWHTPFEESSTAGEPVVDDGASLHLNFSIASVNETHNGVYSCRVVVQLPNTSSPITRETEYTLNLKAVSIVTERDPLVVGIPNEVVCSTRELGVSAIEMIFPETNKTLATANDTSRLATNLVPDDHSLNGKDILCRVYTADGPEFENTHTIQLADFTHDVNIEMSPEVPVAGERFSLICRVISDLPATLSWRGPSGNVSEMTIFHIDGAMTTISLNFDSLKMSDSGKYECLSEIDFHSTDNFSSNAIQIQVVVPPPVVTILRGSNGRMELHSDRTLVCQVDIISEVDTPVLVEIEWDLPPFFSDASKASVSDVHGSGFSYSSVMSISNFTVRESGDYGCTASVTPVNAGSGGGVSNKTVSTREITRLRTELAVNIHVDYTPPDDFNLPSPPYYRPASSVSLACVATNAVGDASYLWFSTNSDSFANGASGGNISRDILTAFDAGYHICTATDEVGNTGTAMTPMELFGAGIYVSSSERVTDSAVPNNTALQFTSHYCNNCRVSFYCLSNSTVTEYRPSVWYYYGRLYPNTTENYVTVTESGTGLFVHNNRYERGGGMYICDIADSNGNIIQLSVGVYDDISAPYMNSDGYINHINSPETNALVTVYCRTYRYPPTYVIWRRNGVRITIDGFKYEAYQAVTDRQGSHYYNALVIRDIAGITDQSEYTCEVGNTAGYRTGIITLYNIPAVSLSLSVDVSPGSPTAYGLPVNEDFSLVCSGVLTSSIPLEKFHLEDNVRVQWSDIKDRPLQNSNNMTITISDVSGEGSVFKSTLLFHPLGHSHDKLYTCSMTLDHPAAYSNVPSDTSDYRVMFDFAFFQLKLNGMLCTEASDRLERDIKETLAFFTDRECRCGFESSLIDQGEFHCNNDIIIYRARIIGSSDVQSSHRVMEILNKWKSSDGTFVFSGRQNNARVWVDPLCPLKIDSFASEILCGD